MSSPTAMMLPSSFFVSGSGLRLRKFNLQDASLDHVQAGKIFRSNPTRFREAPRPICRGLAEALATSVFNSNLPYSTSVFNPKPCRLAADDAPTPIRFRRYPGFNPLTGQTYRSVVRFDSKSEPTR